MRAVSGFGLGTIMLLVGCGGESARHVSTCQAAWQEIKVPEEFLPFFPEQAVWQAGRLVALSLSIEQSKRSLERGLVYEPGQGFSVLSDVGMPGIGLINGAVTVDDAVAFISAANESGAYDPATATWTEIPRVPKTGEVRSVGSLGNAIAIAYDRIVFNSGDTNGHREPVFLSYAEGDEWRDMNAPAQDAWAGRSLAWTGRELLAWGAEDASDASETVSAAARYDPALDTWASVSQQGMPTSPGGSIVWTDPEAVAWGSDPTSAGRYDPVSDSWRPVSPPNGVGFGYPAIAGAGHVVSWTGTSPGVALVTTYDPRNDTWGEAPSRCGPAPRSSPMILAWVGDGIIVWGGNIACDYAQDRNCGDEEYQRAFYLPEAALFGTVRDVGECTCPAPR